MTFLDRLASVQGRIGAGIALVAAVAIGMYTEPRPIDPPKVSAVIVTLVVWLLAEFESAKRVSEHDRSLFSKIFEAFDDDILYFLSNHDFAVSVHEAELKPFHAAYPWAGASFEFTDRTLNRHWLKTKKKIDEFTVLLSETLSPRDVGNRYDPYHTGVPKSEQPEHVYQEIDLLNATASELYQMLDQLKRTGLRRLEL
jgi:hypothetical protein